MRRLHLVLFSTLILSLTLLPSVRQPAANAQDDATLVLQGLDGEVTVIYDQMGVPHIYADSSHDLFMAQGYVEASHRWWQMEWWRHQTAGRLSEIVGDQAIGIDMFLRTLGFTDAASRDLEVLSDDTIASLDAYAAGVNAFLADKSPTELAVEYSALAQAGFTVDIEPWTKNDTLRWTKAMAFDLSGNFRAELERALVAEENPLLPFFMFPEYDFANRPVIVEPGGVRFTNDAAMTWQPSPGLSTTMVGQVDLDDPLLSPFGTGDGIGSNSWVFSGELTDTGLPYLANDPHLGIQVPSIWYEVGLHCNERSAECPYDVVGVTFAGAPAIVIGHNHYAAWGFTNAGADVQDLYVLEINPDNPAQYMLDGEWVDFDLREETIVVNGGEPVDITVRESVWGPVVSEFTGAPGDAVLAMRWTALDPSTLVDALMQFGRVESWEDFRGAAAYFDVPSQNLLYADIDGNIGYQMPGRIPIRADGHNPNMPVDGTTTDSAWQGYVPFEEMPSVFNPPEGYIVTANNSIVGPDYPYHLTSDWASGYRASRIEQMIQNDEDGVFTIEEIQAMQMDNYNMNADTLVPALLTVEFDDERLSQLAGWLAEWDRQNDVDSGEALLFEAFWAELMRVAFVDDFGFVPGFGHRFYTIVAAMLASPEHVVYGNIWDDGTTDAIETPEDIISVAFANAVARLERDYGDDEAAWQWGAAHMAYFRAQPLGQGGIDPVFDPVLDALFNERIAVGGGTAIVNATSYGNPSFGVSALPSMRQILIPGDWDRSLRINTVGQSGDPLSRHYSDQLEMWATGQYHPDWFSREAVEADAAATWVLTPAE